MSDWVSVDPAPSPAAPAAAAAQQGSSRSSSEDAVSMLTKTYGLSDHDAQAVCGHLGAVTHEDLSLVDNAMASEAAQVVGLKPIAAKKWLSAISTICGAGSVPESVSMNVAAAGGGNPKSTEGPTTVPTTPAADSHATCPSTIDPASGSPPVPTAAADSESAKDTNTTTSVRPYVQERVAICIDRSGSMRTGFDESTAFGENSEKTLLNRSRMDAVKQVFYAFRDRTETLDASTVHEVGLLQFDNAIDIMLGLTSSLDDFECIVDDMKPRGATAIYSAILSAVNMLDSKTSDPLTDLRILLLTDGQNNQGCPPEEALSEVARIGAVVDIIIVGDQCDQNLPKIVTATGGECYQIKSLGDGFELMEAENVVSLRARRGGSEKPRRQREAPDFATIKVTTSLTSGKEAARKAGPAAAAAKAKVVSVNKLCNDMNSNSTDKQKAASHNSAGAGASVKRIMSELVKFSRGNAEVFAHSGEGIFLYPDPTNVHCIKALITGPVDSPFEGGVFALNVHVPESYPLRPPAITFETPVYHCNVSDSGRICLDILSDSWSPALTVPKAVEAVRLMLRSPDTDNALRQWIAELTIAYQQFGAGDDRYPTEAAAATKANAARTVEEWEATWDES